MNEHKDGLRELQLLEALEAEPEARQVDLAQRLGIAVGTVNWLLKRLAAKGYIKIQRIGRWHWRYLLTPYGVAEKTRLFAAYVRHSMHLYRETRQEAQRLVSDLKVSGYDRLRLEGDGDLLDICRLTCLEQGVEVADPSEAGVPILELNGHRLSLILAPREQESEDSPNGAC